ncbi:hypothetical protein MRX96_013151 [Rhipicephalus microplus]
MIHIYPSSNVSRKPYESARTNEFTAATSSSAAAAIVRGRKGFHRGCRPCSFEGSRKIAPVRRPSSRLFIGAFPKRASCTVLAELQQRLKLPRCPSPRTRDYD